MNLRPRQLDQPEINLTPLIDVVFLLLIFFMVSTTFREDAVLDLELPDIAASAPAEPADVLLFEIDANGRYFLDGEALASDSVEDLSRALQRALSGRREAEAATATKGPPPLLIRADRESAHGDVMRVLDVAGRLGFQQVRFAAETVDE